MSNEKELERQLKEITKTLNGAKGAFDRHINKLQALQKAAEKRIDYENTSEKDLEVLANAKKIQNLAKNNPEDAVRQAKQMLNRLGIDL